jgi:hypothetical protein
MDPMLLSREILPFYRQPELLIEDLPNELFFQVFIYMVPEDLFKAFGNLNSRFSALIRSAFIHLRITKDNIHLLSMIKENQIESMMLNDFISFQVMVNYFKRNHFTHLKRLDFTFNYLRSIRIFLEIIPELGNLKSLRISRQHSTDCEGSKAFYQTIAELLFTPPFFTQLKYIEIFIPGMMPYYGYMPKPNQLSMLKYFSIFNICLDDLAIIMTWMPQIKFIKIIYAFVMNDDDIQLHEHDLTSRSLMKMPAIISLQRLDIGICAGVTCKVCYVFLYSFDN